MNAKQREIIITALIQHKENGANGDPLGAYNDINDFFKELLESDFKLKTEAGRAITEWENE